MRHIGDDAAQLTSAVYLQVSILSQALIFVTRSRSFSFLERPGTMLMGAFLAAQLVSGSFLPCSIMFKLASFRNSLSCLSLVFSYVIQVATLIAVYCSWGFARIDGVGWGWAGVIWIYSIVTYFPLDIFKFIIRYALSGHAWDSVVQHKVCF